MSEIWFSSDHHFSHANIIDFCRRDQYRFTEYPYAPDVHYMNTDLVKRWNQKVKPQDTVYYLGDFALGYIKRSVFIAKRLNGKKLLVPGNHDKCWPGRGKYEKFVDLYLEAGFEEILPTTYRVDRFLLCHFPYVGDSHENDRFSGNRPNNEGLPLLHGHVHEKWKFKDSMCNVGCDVWDYAPVHMDELISHNESGNF